MAASRHSLKMPRASASASAPPSPVKSEASTTSETDRSGSSASDSDSPTNNHHRHGNRFNASASVVIADPRPRARTVVAESRSRAQSPASVSSSASSPFNPSDRMREAVLQASEHSTSLLLREALRAISVPIRLHHVKRIDCKNDVCMYQYRKRRAKHERVKPPQPSTDTAATTTRILGVTQLHAPITEVIKIIGHSSALSFVLLNPGLADYQTIHTFVNDAHHYTAVKTLSMGDAWNAAHISRRREFVVMEAQQGFQTEDGRKGWIVSYHSLSFSACPELALGAVRGSIYYTGIVAIESEAGSEQIDLFTVAEYNLKGQATDRVNCLAARERVEDTLALLTGTIEQRAATEMELLVSHDFNEIKRLVQLDVCRICIEKVGVVPRRVRTHRCRKCCVSVCDDCSTIWRRGKKEMRLCAGCWGETTVLF